MHNREVSIYCTQFLQTLKFLEGVCVRYRVLLFYGTQYFLIKEDEIYSKFLSILRIYKLINYRPILLFVLV